MKVSSRLLRPLFLMLALVAAAPAIAASKLEDGGTGIVREIVDGHSLTIEMVGTTEATPTEAAVGSKIQVRLVGIQAPELPLGRAGVEAWPLAEESKAALSQLALNKTVRISFGGRKLDRHGRLLAQLYAEDGTWIQGALLSRGMARVYTFADNRMLIDEMLAREREAREAKRGIWADPFYALRSPDETEKLVGTFQIVEGRVVSAAVARGRGYLNFGQDWKRDFTIEIVPSALGLFRQADLDIASFSGKRIRVRGWIESFHGPMIEATHPEQIEVLEP